jgi:hypothetical protein
MLRALWQTLLSGLAFGVVGSLLGLLLGWQVPVYFQAVYDLRRGLDADPITLGAWVGFKQGFVGGWIWFLVLSSLNAWAERDPAAWRRDLQERRRDQAWSSGAPLMFLWLAFAVFLGLMVFRVGISMGRSDALELNNRITANGKSVRLGTVLLANKLMTVTVRQAEIPERVRLQGSVPDQAARDALRDLLTQEFGQGEADLMLSDVEIDSPAAESERTMDGLGRAAAEDKPVGAGTP